MGKKAYPLMGGLLILCILYALVTHTSTAVSTGGAGQASPAAAASEPAHPADEADDWQLILVNKTHIMPEDYTVSTAKVGAYLVDRRIAEPLSEMIDAAAEEGVTLRIGSAYRSVAYQRDVFDRNVEQLKKRGYSEERAKEITSESIADPGTSEHSLGLAVDFARGDNTDFVESYEKTEQFAWLSAHAAEYGFICRYSKDKESITGYTYEPWHYRYVGAKHAREISAKGLCLEEYLGEV